MRKFSLLAALTLSLGIGLAALAAEMDDLSTTDASNTGRFPENQSPSSLNDGARALEGLLAREYQDRIGTVKAYGSDAQIVKITPNRTITSLFDGLEFAVEITATSTATSSLSFNVNSTNVLVPIVKGGSDGTSIAAGDWDATGQSGDIIVLTYEEDAGVFQLLTTAKATTPSAGALDLNGEALTIDADGDTTMIADTDDVIHFNFPSAADDIALTATGVLINGGLQIEQTGRIDLDTDSDTSIRASADDTIDVEIAGADDFQFTANHFVALSGSTLNVDSGGTLLADSGATVDMDGNTVILDADGDTAVDAGEADDVVHFSFGALGANDIALTATGIQGDASAAFTVTSGHGQGLEIGNFTWLTTDGTANQVIETDGSGNLSFVTLAAGGAWTFISTCTPAGAATCDFEGIGSTYDMLRFDIINLHPSADLSDLLMRFDIVGDSTPDTTGYYAATLGTYDTNASYRNVGVANGSSFIITKDPMHVGNANAESMSGSVYVFSPSDTIYYKKASWQIAGSSGAVTPEGFSARGGGYLSVTAAIDHVQFLFDSGNLDLGVIRFYGRNNS